ncbi:hypothetical protein LN996_09030 [Arthrobacter sp. AK01]|uniref:hypothetical protein n=1 Tax=Micrococcaceae TaxID=1268 RepID=UPI001E512799|nr:MULTISPECIES: hypothetical protein [Micrococcaceae]MCD4850949.1 hypothetical protein [Arthrobacter sp. AK01]MCP1415126.1 hypothetical protein [Paenarthrobacter sp. A20]
MALMLVVSIGLAGCAGNPSASSTESTVPTASDTQEEPLIAELTWQEAKASTAKEALEIAALIPKDKITSIVQKETGVLLSCSNTEHNWNGSTSITLTEGSEAESVVKELETAARAHYTDHRFEVSSDRTIQGTFRVEISDPATSEMYLIREDDPGVIRIASGSPCFTLPEGIYPGGDF